MRQFPCSSYPVKTVRRLLGALAFVTAAFSTFAQQIGEGEESTTITRRAPAGPLSPPSTERDKAAQIRDYYSRSEAARSRGDVNTQIAELRRAHAVAEGRNSNMVDLLASALRVIGDLDESRRLREAILATDLPPHARFTHSTTLSYYASGIGDLVAARNWLAAGETLLNQFNKSDSNLAHLAWARGRLLYAQGKFKEAESEYRGADSSIGKQFERNGEKTSPQARYFRNLIEDSLARTLLRQGKIAEAEWVFRDVHDRSTVETSADSVPTARIAIAIAETQVRQGRYEESLRYASTAIAKLEEQQIKESSGHLARALLMTGWAHGGAGHFENAIKAFEHRARVIVGNGSPHSVVWGYALIRTARAEASLPMLRAHLESSQSLAPNGYVTHERAGMYAYALMRVGRAAEARTLFESAIPGLIRGLQNRRAADRTEALSDLIANWVIEGYLESLSTDAESGNVLAIEEMFRLADFARGSSVDRALALATTRATIADPALASIARREQDLGNRQAALSRIVEDLLARPRDKQPLKVIADIRRDIDAAAKERESLRRDIALQFPQYSRLIAPRPTSIAEVRNLLKPGEVMLSTYTAHDCTYVWAVPQSGPLRFARSSLGTNDIAARVKKLRKAFDVGDVSLAAFPVFDTAEAYALYKALLKPVETAWARADSLIVVPHGPLGQLPFALLPTAPVENTQTTDFDNYRSVPWLIRRMAVSQLPSASALLALRGRALRPTETSSAFIGFGDPDFGNASRTAPANIRALSRRNLQIPAGGDPARPSTPSSFSRLPQLPDTALELRDIAAILKADSGDIFLGSRASETNVKNRRLDGYRVLMFATHGLVPGELDGLTQPALALSNPAITGEKDADGLLTMDEVLGLQLNADWVVLSACNTASGDGAGSEAISGLGRAFFYAGASALLVTNWPVETVSARLITTDLFRRQSERPSLSRGEALREVMLNMIDRTEVKDDVGRTRYTYAHPVFWAPFSIVGDAGL